MTTPVATTTNNTGMCDIEDRTAQGKAAKSDTDRQYVEDMLFEMNDFACRICAQFDHGGMTMEEIWHMHSAMAEGQHQIEAFTTFAKRSSTGSSGSPSHWSAYSNQAAENLVLRCDLVGQHEEEQLQEGATARIGHSMSTIGEWPREEVCQEVPQEGTPMMTITPMTITHLGVIHMDASHPRLAEALLGEVVVVDPMVVVEEVVTPTQREEVSHLMIMKEAMVVEVIVGLQICAMSAWWMEEETQEMMGLQAQMEATVSMDIGITEPAAPGSRHLIMIMRTK
ncbi:hypothetical protein NEOLEDRAFT_1152675 [Neolentinus lepideus HHB14362 ss-1]|uniref:Uncharacterized protein n=1 Tax=Neolentinus lepideus HHB14362 ss-1 TaxID=1314782 RepID=A0A165MHD4_9AGAM|nr:hypothetical protein NEOLEDRAFT_1152675 [Neolentinus lepideus HHB14362 ss-1]